MTAAWMAYGITISCLLSAAALAVEHACRVRRWPSRWIWAVVLAAPLLLPFTAAVVSSLPDRALPPAAAERATTSPANGVDAAASAREITSRVYRPEAPQELVVMLAVAWVGGSVLLAVALFISWLRMRRRSASWAQRTLDGTNVLVSDDIGPAVIGFLRPRIVVPQWLFAADAGVRRLTLTHESEHVRARDPLLFLAGTVLVLLLPWNLPLWWQLRRLRFAIEVDCDVRVLASGSATEAEYGEALLAVAERSAAVPLAAAAMCESPSTLEKRIRVLLLDRSARQHAIALALVTGGLAVAAGAAQLDAPATVGLSRQQLMGSALGRELLEAVADGDSTSAAALIDTGADVDRVVLGDGTPLIAAARRGDAPLVSLLLERGAHVDLPVRGDGSPLIAASTLGNLAIVTALVERGADVNGFVLGDETPLINAARAGNLDIVRYLVARGADINLAVPAEAVPAPEIRSPLSEALKHGRTQVVDYLRAHGAQR